MSLFVLIHVEFIENYRFIMRMFGFLQKSFRDY